MLNFGVGEMEVSFSAVNLKGDDTHIWYHWKGLIMICQNICKWWWHH